MTIAKRNEWLKIALIATIGSALGACLGYFIGYIFFNEIGIKIFELYGVDNTSFLKEKISSEGGVIAWITLLAIAGFTPVPFKLLTITSGFVHFNFLYFIIISILTRGLRFFLIAFLIGNFGPTMKKVIEKKLLKVSIFVVIILIIFAYFVYNFLVNFTK
jgi:membrane protein YqaA with SNARE-associated domain